MSHLIRPTNFHPDLYLESQLTASCVDPGAGDHLEACQQTGGGRVVDRGGAVICSGITASNAYHGLYNVFLLLGVGDTASHPLRHTAMVLIDMVAQIQEETSEHDTGELQP